MGDMPRREFVRNVIVGSAAALYSVMMPNEIKKGFEWTSSTSFMDKSAIKHVDEFQGELPLSNKEFLEGYRTLKTIDDLRDMSGEDLFTMAIIGEAADCSPEEQIAIGYTVMNRMNDHRHYNGEGSLEDVLLKKYLGKTQYMCFKHDSKNKKVMENFERTIGVDRRDKNKEWKKSKEIVDIIMEDRRPELNRGQTGYVTNREARALSRKDNWFTRSNLVPMDGYYLHTFISQPNS